jgi:hypothetical protein
MKDQFCKAAVDKTTRNQLIKKHMKTRVVYLLTYVITTICFFTKLIDEKHIGTACMISLFTLIWFTQNENDLRILKKMNNRNQ